MASTNKETMRHHREDCRFTAMCVPGDLDDGTDTNWYVYDLRLRTSVNVGAGASARILALQMARNATRASMRREAKAVGHG